MIHSTLKNIMGTVEHYGEGGKKYDRSCRTKTSPEELVAVEKKGEGGSVLLISYA